MKNKSLYKSFKCALEGIFVALKEERNTKIHFTAAVVVIILGALLRFSVEKLAILVLVCGLVVVSETFNTAIERIVDVIQPDYCPKAKIIKDISAGAVLLAAIIAVVVGVLIFGPVLIELYLRLL